MERPPLHLSDADLDAWRDQLLFGAYAPDPDAAPPEPTPAPPYAGATPPPVQFLAPPRRHGRVLLAVRAVAVAAVATFAVLQLLAWLL